MKLHWTVSENRLVYYSAVSHKEETRVIFGFPFMFQLILDAVISKVEAQMKYLENNFTTAALSNNVLFRLAFKECKFAIFCLPEVDTGNV